MPLVDSGPLALFILSGVAAALYLVLTLVSARTGATRSDSAPGWLARRRARAGIGHLPDAIGIGYRGALGPTRLDLAQLNHHGYIGGAPGSGKTTLLRLLAEAYPGPVIALDAKGSPDLADTFHSIPGIVWEIGGGLQLDLLDTEPAILAQQLLEGEIFTDRAAVYRAIAEHAVQRAGWVLRWRGDVPAPARILELISSPATLAAAIRSSMPRDDRMATRWLVELDSPTQTIREAYLTFGERLGGLVDSPAGASLGTGPGSLSLATVIAADNKLLIRLDPRYGQISRKVGAWALVAMLRLAAELRQAQTGRRCLFIVDEPRLLGHEGRHLADLFGTARDAGIGLVVADQGIAGLATVHNDLPDAILRSTGWQVVLRQGSPVDAERMAALFGSELRPDTSNSSDGRSTTRWRREPKVDASQLQDLPTGSAWLHVAAIGTEARERITRVALALPAKSPHHARLALPPGGPSASSADGYQTAVADGPNGRNDPDREVVLRLVGDADENGCRQWLGSHDQDGYPRAWWRGGYRRAGRLLYGWQRGEIPAGYTLDHVCRQRWCVEVAHLEPVPRAEHARREIKRQRVDRKVAPTTMPVPSFAVSLFKAVDQPMLTRQVLTIVELEHLLTTFDKLGDKRRGRCWSPTEYDTSASSRSDAGVTAITCLVFDLDRLPPDATRLAGLHWIAHTTWSHRPERPKWRLVLPLVYPVPKGKWSDVWLRARAELCPDADPACKDPSRQYFLPAHPPEVTPNSTVHPGQLLDPAGLPDLAAPTMAANRPMRTSRHNLRASTPQRATRYMERVIDNLASAQPGSATRR
jgi:Type IV secretion-system coupling protein DNA-binding domain